MVFSRNKIRCVLLAALVGMSPVTFATPPWFVRTWQSDEGLPDNSVAGICQTPDGFLWVATLTGLVRFDGLQFRQIRLPGDNRLAVGQAILSDRLGRLWIAKDRGGVICMDAKGGLTHFSPREGLPDKEARRIEEDGEGGIWVSFFSGEVVRIRGSQVRQFTREDGLPGGETCYLAHDRTGLLWFTQGGWLGFFREERFHPLHKLPPERTRGERSERIAGSRAGGLWVCLGSQLYNCSEKEGLVKVGDLPAEASEAEPTALYEDRTGRLWIGTRQEDLFSFDGKVFEKSSTSHQTITVVAEDREGNIWAGTQGGGLKQLSPTVVTLMPMDSTLPFEGVRSLCQDTAGRLWAIIAQRRTVMYSNGEGWTALTAEAGWTYTDADCLAADPAGGVWVGTSFHGLHRWQDGKVTASFTTTNGLGMENVSALLTTTNGAVWVGLGSYDTAEHALQRWMTGQTKTFTLPVGSGEVTALATDLAGDCWVGTDNGQLLRVHGNLLIDETSKTVKSQPGSIRSLLVTPDGALWIGYGGQGLGRLKDGRFTQCRMSEGLPDDYLSLLLEDGHGRLWIAGNRGIFRVPKKTLEDVMEGRMPRVWPVVYRQKDGLSGVQASYNAWPSALRSADGRLLFAMQSGLAAVCPDHIKEDAKPPAVQIERVNVNGQTVAAYREGQALTAAPGAAPVELAHDGVSMQLPASSRRQVEFVFTAPNFTVPESIGFKYRLQGLDSAWMDAGTKRSAVYPLIPPGHYRFQVTACNSDGNWSGTGAVLELTVAHFWWETAWFQGASLFALIALLGGGLLLWSRRRYHFKLERLKVLQATERERMRIAQDLHDDLGANLTQIAYLGDTLLTHTGLPPDLSNDIEKMRCTAREATRALDETVWAVDPGQDTLEGLAGYLAFFAQDYLEGAQLSCRLDIPETLPPLCVPSEVRHHLLLAFKEILTNIIRHARATVVDIRFAVEGAEGVLCITDNGCGFEVEASETRPGGGHGMASIHKRLESIGGQCEVQSQLGSGTEVRLRWRFP
jgi:signal transduction histidine kinase/ligand-binding sensor domain-containing protein